MTYRQIQIVVESCLLASTEQNSSPCQRPSESDVRKALSDYVATTPYPGKMFCRLAFDFYAKFGTVAEQCAILDRWKATKGNPSEPYKIYCEFGSRQAVPKDVFKVNLEEILKREPTNPTYLLIAYNLALAENKKTRRLFYALQLTKGSPTVADFVRYGIECRKLAIPESAVEAFQTALKMEPTNVSALNGLASCAFEMRQLDRAAELFRNVLRVAPGDKFSRRMLAKMNALRNDQAWMQKAEQRRKFYKQWEETELTRLTDEKRSRMMAEVAARKPRPPKERIK
jgi:tetratricopeptide (TPR) repeat protein